MDNISSKVIWAVLGALTIEEIKVFERLVKPEYDASMEDIYDEDEDMAFIDTIEAFIDDWEEEMGDEGDDFRALRRMQDLYYEKDEEINGPPSYSPYPDC